MEHRGGGVANRGRDLLRELGSRIAGRIDARDARAHVLVGDEVAVLVVVDVLLEEMAADRLEADEHEDALDLYALGLAVAVDVDPLDVAVPSDLLDLGWRDRLDLVHLQKAVLKDRLGAELIAAVDDVELLGETGQEEALLKGGVASPDDREVGALEERAVADGAVRDAAAVIFLLTDDAELRRLAADGNEHGVRRKLGSVPERHDLVVALGADLLHRLVGLDLETEFESVVSHLSCELGSGDGLESGIVLYQLGVEDLSTDVFGVE